MHIGLGIDTGGTFTDAALYDFENESVLDSSKSPTTKNNLRKGIENALDRLDGDYLKQVNIVSLSTTLATNACVEDKGGNSKLILIGCHPTVIEKYGPEYGLPDSSKIILLDGKIGDDGKIEEEPNWDILKQKLSASDKDIDCYAVVQTWSMKNPIFEKKAEKIIKNKLNKPVVCGYELSSRLNVLKRAASALLNAKLIPVIKDFMQSMIHELRDRNITAPVVIVRGDGSIMSLDFALKRPVETLLSGPAASIHGGMLLSSDKNSIIVDIGGTTSDIAIVKDGYPDLLEDGAVVGEWKTATPSVDIHTCGAGGDSEVKIDKNLNISIGPNRVIPLCTLASKYPKVSKRLNEIYESKITHTRPLPVFYVLTGQSKRNELSEYDLRIVKALNDGPLDILTLCDNINTSVYAFKPDYLERRGIITKSGLTPTDVMHIKDDFTKWDKQASETAVNILSGQYGLSVDEICSKTYKAVVMKIYGKTVQMLLEKEQPGILSDNHSEFLNTLLEYSSYDKKMLSLNFNTKYNVCGLGAPARIFIPEVAKLLNSKSTVPKYSHIANALGAVTGKITCAEEGMIHPRYEDNVLTGYIIWSKNGSIFFKEYNEAIRHIKSSLKELAIKNAQKRGACNIKTDIDIIENKAEIVPDDYSEEDDTNTLLVDTKVVVRAVGKLHAI